MIVKQDYKNKFLDDLLSEFSGKETHILDMGSGTSANFIDVLKKNKNFYYTGIEFNEISLSAAHNNLKELQNAVALHGYGEGFDEKKDTYDVVVSLSVLEHVKCLEKFLLQSISMCKSGGMVIHRYDLGHSLYPSSLREQFTVWLSLRAPFIFSKNNFTTHPSLKKIVGILEQNGLKNIEVDYSQSFSFKKLMNKLNPEVPGNNNLAKKILDFEDELKSHFLTLLNENEKELIFPTITVKGIKG